MFRVVSRLSHKPLACASGIVLPSLVRKPAFEVYGLERLLEDGSIKLASVVTDVTGFSAQSVLEATVERTEGRPS